MEPDKYEMEWVRMRIGDLNRQMNDLEYRNIQISCLGEILRELTESYEKQQGILHEQLNELTIRFNNATNPRLHKE